eukprot:TRINITY_DN29165_c0_g1_i1.p1 TRINITY_DN29165_c0_g1~~TRINITY_DN29165_c0_g1_i1.p1  ORF type:complete len:354 (-),score=88.59 TRINITY_DN29165_c0_g1_i1:22-1083(-)
MPASDAQRDAHLFHAKVQEHCEHITNLTEVLQGEQERATASELAAASDRARLDDLTKEMRAMKVLRQQDIHTINALRQDVVSLEERMSTAHSNLQSHSGEHQTAGDRLSFLEGAMEEMRRRASTLEDHSEMARNGLESGVRRATQQANDIQELHLALSALRGAHEVSEQRREELTAAHGDTSSSLRETSGTTLPAMMEQASADRLKLNDTWTRLAALETEQFAAVSQQLNSLQGLAENSDKELQAANDQLAALMESLQQLESRVQQESETSKITREQLQDAHDRVQHLQGLSNDAGAGLRQNHNDLGELRADVRQQASQVGSLAEALAALRLEQQNTYDEVGALSALVHVGKM